MGWRLVASFDTHWAIGAIEGASAMGVTIDASAETIAAGSYYLYDGTGSRSLLTQLVTAMTSAGVGSPTATLTESGHVRLTSSGTFSVTWTNTTLRDLLGFTNNLSGNPSYTASRWSTLFWSPTYRFQTATPDGIAANRVPDTQIVMSRTGKNVDHISNHEMEIQQLKASAVPIVRVWTTSGYGGEYRTWHDTVFEAGGPFKIYDVTEDTSSSNNQTLSTVLGPYKAREIEHEWYNRVIRFADVATDITLDVVKVDDI